MTSNEKNARIESKSTELTSILETVLRNKMNIARIKFLGLFIVALCKVQTVCFEKLASGFEANVKRTSSLRRIQRFMAEYILDGDIVAQLIFSLLPHNPPYIIAIDRTNWKFGSTNINALVISIIYDGVSFPILFKLMDKRGNSNTKDRIDIMERYIRLFGKNTIQCLVADREFVGEKWMEYLNENNIKYYLRIRENFWVDDPRTGNQIKACHLFNSVKLNECIALRKIYSLKQQLCYLSASKIKNKQGKPELQIIVSFNEPQNAQEIYKERWQIETAFRALKTSGFNIEDTHLNDLDRIEKLFSIVIIAFTWAFLVGIYLHENVKPIRMLKHGRRAQSFVKYGLNYISSVLLNPLFQDDINICKFLSCT
jgi:hypothetical protein